jgi:DNA-binding transcriptional MocR family regulator
MLEQTIGPGANRSAIAAAVEGAVSRGELVPGEHLPPVRRLASALAVSPATVAAAYKELGQRGVVIANGRRGTAIAPEPPLRAPRARSLPAGVLDLAGGNPDQALLPPLAPALARIDPEHKLYGGPANLEALVAHARSAFSADGVDGEIVVAGGALDGIERVLQTRLRPGDVVAVEDPSWPRIRDLVQALGLVPEPVALDEYGFGPAELERALRRAKAVITTPRGQNPTGAALDEERSGRLRELLARHPDVLVVEDDYVAGVAGVPYQPLHGSTRYWAVVRSLSKVLGPDLRIALVAGDPLTVSRVEGRLLVGAGWVSHLLQQTASQLLGDARAQKLIVHAERRYGERREALLSALRDLGLRASGRSGLGVWIPVAEEAATVELLLEAGFAVSAGERYRYRTPPAIRVTTTTLEPSEARELAATLASVARPGSSTYPG